MERFSRYYRLEFWTVFAGLLTSVVIFMVFELALQVSKDKLTYTGLANAGLLFVIGNIYARLKERRDGMRKRAQDLFLEWHSKEIRESRIYVSRWRRANANVPIPSLSDIEEFAIKAALEKYSQAKAPTPSEQPANPTSIADTTITSRHPLDDPEQMELHFFRIYQFFERWSLLIKQSDIDQWSANQYMSSYKPWYMKHFISHWAATEKDEYIANSLNLIVTLVKAE